MNRIDDVLDALKASERSGETARSEEILRDALLRFPDVLDKFRSPVVCKELVRLLVAQGRFEEAREIVDRHGSAGERGWHHILFARAYDAAGDRVLARQSWEAFGADRPDHPEARAALSRSGRHVPVQPFKRILDKVPSQVFDMVFDIGANTGQSCLAYAEALPDSVIHAFEPAPQAFAALTSRLGSAPNIVAHNLALSDRAGAVAMSMNGASPMNRVVEGLSQATVRVEAATVAQFCAKAGIDHVHFMKIDTEGHDLAVLRGCGDFLARVDFIQCEASANHYNRFHNAFAEILDFLTASGFYLFDIQGITYEQANGGYPVLRRFDPVFINRRIVGEMRNVVDR